MAGKSEKFNDLLASYQGNAFPVIIEDLAKHLGVTEASIRRIAPGWAPVVEFKKGKNYQGWWAIPERDDQGVTVGLALRNQADFKAMYPGSKHGLCYEVNPDHSRGDKGYTGGPQNWVRTMDVGVCCAICGKPDGCLLSAESPSDPKAVICRVKASEHPMKMGYLHIRKPEADFRGRAALADNGKPVVIVEGFSDTCAAMDLGFNAVGRPSNLAGLDTLGHLVRGRPVIIMGENDQKADGSCPGREGMIAAFQVLVRTCKSVVMLMPPSHFKDLRAWKNVAGLTEEAFVQYVERHGEKTCVQTVLEDDRPLTAARAFLNENYLIGGRYGVRRWRGDWFHYTGGRYQSVPKEKFEAPLRPWAHGKWETKVSPSTGAIIRPAVRATNIYVSNLLEAIKGETLIDDETSVPCWINGADGPNARDMVAFSNGILHLPSHFAGYEALNEPTPDLFTTAALPFPFDPTAGCTRWKIFLASTLGDEPLKIDLLQEWMGYCMVPDTTMQKFMYLRGPTGAGKGVILNILTELVGPGQAAATNFASIAGEFGMQPLVGKLIATVGDARIPHHSDSMRGLEALLNMTGDDFVPINRKHKEHMGAVKLMCRLTMASNEILNLPDHASAVLRRLLIIPFNRSFAKREDTSLTNRLRTEIQGIANWALIGLHRLRKNGVFTTPDSMVEAKAEWRVACNPLAAFVEECCDEGGAITKLELFDAWTSWSNERRMRPTTRSQFFDRMRTAIAGVTTEIREERGHKIALFNGIRLKPWAAKRFNGRP